MRVQLLRQGHDAERFVLPVWELGLKPGFLFRALDAALKRRSSTVARAFVFLSIRSGLRRSIHEIAACGDVEERPFQGRVRCVTDSWAFSPCGRFLL